MNYYDSSEVEVTPASEIISRIFTNIEKSEIENGNKVLRAWKSTVESIRNNSENGHNLGKNLASHSRIIDLKNGVLLVEVDHSGWIQILKIYQKYIITGLKKHVPYLKIDSITFRNKGSSAKLADIRQSEDFQKKMMKNMENQFEKEEEMLKKFEFNSKKSENSNIGALPDSVQKIFDSMRCDMLTKKQ